MARDIADEGVESEHECNPREAMEVTRDIGGGEEIVLTRICPVCGDDC